MKNIISNTKIKKRKSKKNSPEIVETIELAKKNSAWIEIAKLISGSRRKYSSVNLKTIESNSKEGDTIVVPGKVLGSGNVEKRIKVCAVSFSESAKEKIKKSKGEVVILVEEIKRNPKAEGIKMLR